MSIISQVHPTTHNPMDLLKTMYKLWKAYFTMQKKRGEYLFKCLMIYCNTPPSGSLQSLIQILQSRCARSDLPMSNAARQQLGLQPEKLRTVNKYEHLPSHDLYIGQNVVYQDVTCKWWYLATITSLCVCSPEVTILLQGKVSPTGRHKLTWSHMNQKARSQKMNILVYNLVICRPWKLAMGSLIIKTIQYNLILDQRGTLRPQ